MQFSSPQLEDIGATVSNDGRLSEFTLQTSAGETLCFQLSYRETGRLSGPIQKAAREMRRRLVLHQDVGAAELLAATANPHTVDAVLVEATPRGDVRLVFETKEGGGTQSLVLPNRIAGKLLAKLEAVFSIEE
jgi:hypothetical protein